MSTVIKTSKDTLEPGAVPVKKKHIWWRVLLAWLGGFIFFPLAVVGVIFAGGSLFTISQIVSMTGGNPEEYIGESYKDKTITQMIFGLQNMKFDTLNDINEITPLVRKTIEEQLNPVLEQFHLTLDWDEIKDRTFTKPEGDGAEDYSIGTYFSTDFLDKIQIANFIEGAEELKGVYQYFLYDVIRDPETGEPLLDEHGNVQINNEDPYSIRDFMSGADFLNDLINYITIGDVIDIDENSEQILQTIQYWNLGSFNDNIATLSISDLFSPEDIASSKILEALKESTIDTLATDINNVELGQLFSDEDIASNAIIKALQHSTLTSLASDLNTKTIGDFLEVYKEVEVPATFEEGTEYYYYDAEEAIYVLDTTVVSQETLENSITTHGKVYTVTNKILKALSTLKLDDFSNQNKIQEVIGGLYVGDLFSSDDGSSLFKVIAGYTIDELRTEDLTETIKIGDILEVHTLATSYDSTAVYYYFDPVEQEYKQDTSITDAASFETAKVTHDIFTANPILHALENNTIKSLTDANVIMNLKLVDVLGESTIQNNDILKAIYNNDHDVTINDLKSLDVNEYKLADLLGLDTIQANSLLNALYENNHDVTVGDLTDEDTIMALHLYDVVDVGTDTSNILYIIAHKENPDDPGHAYSIGNLSSAVDALTLQDIYPAPTSGTDTRNKIIAALADKKDTDGNYYRVNDLGGAIDQLILSDVVDTSGSTILTSLAGYQITELGTAINNLTLGQVVTIDSGSPKILQTLQNSNINDLASSLDNLSLFDVMDIDESDKLLYAIAKQREYDSENFYEADRYFEGTEYFYKVGENYTLDSIVVSKETFESEQALHGTLYSHYHYYRIDELSSAVGKLTLTDITDVSQSTLLASLADKGYYDYDEVTSYEAGKDYYYEGNQLTSDYVLDETIVDATTFAASLAEHGHLYVQGEFHLYTINDLGKAVAALTLNEVVQIDSNSPKILQTLSDAKLEDVDEIIVDLTLADVIDIYDAEGYHEIKDYKSGIEYFRYDSGEDLYISLGVLSDEAAFNTAKETYGKVYAHHDQSNSILRALSEKSIFSGGLEDGLSSLKFKDVFSEDDCADGFLKCLWDNTNGGDFVITNIGTEINKLKLVDFLDQKIFETDASKKNSRVFHIDNTIPSSPVYTRVGDSYKDTEAYVVNDYVEYDGKAYKCLSATTGTWDASKWTLVESDDYIVKQKITSTWWFLLTEEGETFTSDTERYILGNGGDYKFDDMDKLVTNMEYHMKKESVFNLIDAGLIEVSDEDRATFEMKVDHDDDSSTDKVELGSLNITEFTQFVIRLLKNPMIGMILG